MTTWLYAQDGSGAVLGFGSGTPDLIMAEKHEHTTTITSHPVEKGVNITDHVRDMPDSLSLDVWVTNTPLDVDIMNGRGAIMDLELAFPRYKPPFDGTPGAIFRKAKELGAAAVDAIMGNQPPPPTKAKVLAFSTVFDRVREVQEKLTAWKTSGVFFLVVTASRTYENMVIESVTLPREERGGAAFTIAMKQIRTVSTATVTAPQPKEARGAPAKDKGAQSPQSGTDAAKSTSLAMKALASLGL